MDGSQLWCHSFQHLFIPGVIQVASHRLEHNDDLSNVKSEPPFFPLCLITACFKRCLMSSSCFVLCSSCPSVRTGQHPLCTGLQSYDSAESLHTLMTNETDLCEPILGGCHLLHHIPFLGNWKYGWVNYIYSWLKAVLTAILLGPCLNFFFKKLSRVISFKEKTLMEKIKNALDGKNIPKQIFMNFFS